MSFEWLHFYGANNTLPYTGIFKFLKNLQLNNFNTANLHTCRSFLIRTHQFAWNERNIENGEEIGFFPLVLKNPISSPFSIYPFHSVLLLSSIVYKCHVRVRQGVCNRSELLSRSTPSKARVAFLYIVHFKLAEKFTDCLYFWFSLSFVTEDFGLVIWVPSRAFWVF